MDIDITANPPEGLLQAKKKYRRLMLISLLLALCAVIMAVCGVVLDWSHDETLLDTGFALFLAAAFLFVYFVEKYQEYREVDLRKQKKLNELASQYPEISAYCGKILAEKRSPMVGEYDAMVAHARLAEAGEHKDPA